MRKIEVTQLSSDAYKVDRLENTASYDIGEILDKADVKVLARDRRYKVIIKENR